jgi:hypothetical protein
MKPEFPLIYVPEFPVLEPEPFVLRWVYTQGRHRMRRGQIGVRVPGTRGIIGRASHSF